MALTLHDHPLASFCWKVLIGLYENDIAFTPAIVDLGDARSREAFLGQNDPYGLGKARARLAAGCAQA